MDYEEVIILKAQKSFFYRNVIQVLAGLFVAEIYVTAAWGWLALLPTLVYFPVIFYINFKLAVCPACKRPIGLKLKGTQYCQFCGVKLKY